MAAMDNADEFAIDELMRLGGTPCCVWTYRGAWARRAVWTAKNDRQLRVSSSQYSTTGLRIVCAQRDEAPHDALPADRRAYSSHLWCGPINIDYVPGRPLCCPPSRRAAGAVALFVRPASLRSGSPVFPRPNAPVKQATARPYTAN